MKRIMLTGGTGYIGSWIAKFLLEEGYTVSLTVRDKTRINKIQHLLDIEKASSGKLEIAEADLLKEGSFAEAMQGCDAVIHTASPFMIGNVKDPYKMLIDPALKGTRNVLETANKTASVKRLVLTSSIVAICGDNIDVQKTKDGIFTESDWNESSSATHNPYPYSKALAEREAWKIHDAQDQWDLVVLNPGFVMGPSLTQFSESGSISFMLDMLKGKNKMGVPDLMLTYVDVRDIAKAHILSLQKPEANGRNIIISETHSMLAFAQLVETNFPNKFPLPKKLLPTFMLYLAGWTQGVSWRFINTNIGYDRDFDNSKSKNILKMEYINFKKTIKDHVQQLMKNGKV